MQSDFLIIAITAPEFFPEEAKRIEEILSSGEAHFVHIRKPAASVIDVRRLLEEINPKFLPQIKIHDHFELIETLPVGGIHLNSRNSQPHPKAVNVSKSCHSPEEIDESLDYCFISPVFDSISKDGYKASFYLDLLSLKIRDKKVIALGGVTPEKFPILKSLGFYGAALLGHFFPPLKN